MVRYDTEYKPYVVSDSTQKIFKLGSNVLFGAAGLFRKGETPSDPFKECDMGVITYDSAKTILMNHASAIAYDLFRGKLARQYVLGGKDENGEFHMVTMSHKLDGEFAGKFLVTDWTPYVDGGISATILLPFQLPEVTKGYMNMLSNKIKAASSTTEIISAANEVLQSIADNDETVGHTGMAIMVT